MKKKTLQRLLATALAGIMVMSMVACGAEEEQKESSQAPVQSSSSTEKEETPAAPAEPVKLTIALSQNTNVENYDTNYMTLKMEEELGIDVEFEYYPSSGADAKTKFSTTVNGGGDLPDIVIMDMNSAEVYQYGDAGIFIPLNDYLADSSLMPNFNTIAEEYPEDMEVIKSAITSPDGNIYSMFNWSPEDWNFTPYRFWINQTWLDNLDLDMPTTTEQFAEVMEAFATQDPNGNGIKDEIAITGSKDAWGGYTPYFLINSFVFYNADMQNGGLALEDGKVVAPFTTNAWRDALEYMHDLCDKGILDPAVFTMDTATWQALLAQEPNVVGATCAGGFGYWSGGLDNVNFQDFVLCPPLEGPEGIAYTPSSRYSPQLTFFITSDCENPETAIKLADWFLAIENSHTVRYGEEGVEWSMDEADTSTRTALYASEGYDCNVAILNDIWSQVQNKMWYGVGVRYTNIDYYRGKDALIKDGDTRDADIRANSYACYGEAYPELLPNLIYNQEETEKIAEIQTNVKDYVKSQLAEFVTGNRPLSDWDSYLDEIEAMGLPTWLEVAQSAYDRMTE